MRLGVALLLPEPVRTEVDGLRRALGDPTLPRIPPHLTLVPPVNVRDDRMHDALAVLREAAVATKPFRLVLGPPATFLPVNPTVYLDVGGDPEALHALRDRVFRDPLERRLTWPFVPHVTIADDIDPDRIPAAVAALADYRAEVLVERVHLLQEGPGRTWTPVADAPFAARAVVARGGLPLELSVSERPDPEAAAFEAAQGGEATDASVAVTARRDGRVVGVAVARADLHAGLAHLSRLVVDAEVRGEGVGSHLLAAFESWAAEQGCGRLRVCTRAGDDAGDFYRHRGWRSTGESQQLEKLLVGEEIAPERS
ncbi:MAG TPA: GNAT family N-acetyltransferase [Acidimicrobiales bacterium]|nr:GNAT family N-acetyltransferase [Acidimicrobiales bacterium]